ncbi:carbohydrate ABC transporter permease [Microbacterium sp. X-17]|uniref:carbohydrate ABC transporter permease n=1 Tax=Microbacterium sp. X-17 TaxID=3144404 RepID=UPI0031F4BC7E
MTTQTAALHRIRASRRNPDRFRTSGQRTGRVVITVLVILWAVLCAIPVLIAVYSSFKTQADIITNPFGLPIPPYLQNYVTSFQGTLGGQPMTVYLLNSAISTILGIILCTIGATLAGYYLARKTNVATRISSGYFLVLLTLPPVVTILPLFTLAGQLGLRNSPWGLGLVLAAAQLPLAVVLMRTFFANFPHELTEAAALDGASEGRTFMSIVVPLMRGPIGTVALLQGIGMWNELTLAVVLMTNSDSYTVPLGLSLFRTNTSLDLGAQFAGLTIAIIPILIAYTIFNKQFIDGLRVGAVK